MKLFELKTKLDEDSIAKIIRNECKPFLKEMRGASGPLYRGIGTTLASEDLPDGLYKKTVRKDRSSVDTGAAFSKMLDSYMKEKSNINHRTQSIFCCFSKSMASNYGVPCVIFPIGKIQYAWSPYIKDAYNELDPDSEPIWTAFSKKMTKYFRKAIMDLNILPGFSSDFPSSIELIHDDFMQLELLDRLKVVKKILDDNNLFIFNKDLIKVPKTTEIMINSDEYYVIKASDYKKSLHGKIFK